MDNPKLIFGKQLDFYAGLALATPFLASILPSVVVYLSLLLLIPFSIVWILQYRLVTIRFLNPLVLCFVALVATHLMALAITGTPFLFDVWRGIIGALILIAIYLLGRTSERSSFVMLEGFLVVLVPVAVCLSVLSIVKLYLNGKGIQLPFLGSPYPQAGSLKSDYNISSFTMLLCALVVLGKLLYAHLEKKKFILYLGVFLLLSVGSFVAGSRRILIMAPIALSASFIVYFYLSKRMKLRHLLFVLSGFFLAIFTLLKVTSFGFVFDALMESMGSGQFLGFISRVGRWALALDLLAQQNFYEPMGFSYHHIYACKFNDCTVFDYPHFTPLSEWLVSGVLGLVLAVSIFVMMVFYAIRSGSIGIKTGMVFVILVTIPHSIISGDTLITNPQILGVLLLLCSLCEQKKLTLKF